MSKRITLFLLMFIPTSIVNVFSQANAGPDQEICADSTYMQAVDPFPNTGYWEAVSGSGLIENPSLFNSKVTLVGHGENVFRWVVNVGSILYYDTITITNNSPGEAKIIGPVDTTTCDGTITLTAEMPVPYYECDHYWTLIAGYGNFNSQSNDFTVNVTELAPDATVFAWNLQNGVCWKQDIIIIQNNQVEAHAGDDQMICADSTVLDAVIPNSIFPFQGTGYWTNLSGNMAIIENLNNPVSRVSNLPQGTTILEWTVELENCSADDLVIITNNDFELTAGPDITVCDDYMEIPIENNTSWSYLSGCGSIDENTTTNMWEVNLCAGENELGVTVTNGICSATDTLIVYNQLPSNAEIIIPLNDTIIYQDLIQLTAVEPIQGNGIWTVDSPGVTFDNATSFSTTANNIPLGSHLFTWTVSNNICSPSTNSVTVTRNELKAFAGEDFFLPDYASSARLNAVLPPGTDGYWTVLLGTGILDDPTDPNTMVLNLSEGENRLRWTVSYAKTSDEDEIVITKLTETVYAGPDQQICGDTVRMQAANPFPYSGEWSIYQGWANIIDPTLYNTEIKFGRGINLLIWTVNIENVFYKDTVEIVNNEILVIAGQDAVVCMDYYHLSSYTNPESPGIWSLIDGNGIIVDPTLEFTMVTNLGTGENIFRWTASNEFCSNFDDVSVISTLPEKFNLNAGPDQTVFTNSTVMNADPTPEGWEGIWTTFLSDVTIVNPSQYNTEVTDLRFGPNILEWHIVDQTYGCHHSDHVTITYLNPLVNAGPDQEICADATYMQASDPTPYTGEWILVNGSATIVNPYQYNTLVTNLGPGENTFRWEVIIEDETLFDYVTVTNNALTIYAGEDQTLPPMTDETYFEADLAPDQTGYWSILSGGAHITDINDPVSFVYDLQNGVNTFRWNVSNSIGCEGSDEIDILVANFVPNAGPDQIVCSDTAKLNATFVVGADSQYWILISGQSTFDDIYDPKTVVRNILWGANIYRWMVYFPGYSDYDDVVITIDSIFVSAGEDASVCDASYQMDAQFIEGAEHLWTPIGIGGGTIIDNSAWNTLITNLPIGTNVFNWHVDNGHCTSDDVVVITRNAQPIADFTVTPEEFTAPQEVIIENSSSFVPGFTEPDEFRWFIDDEFLGTTYNYDAFYHTFTNTGTSDSIYNIELIAADNETGCMDTVTHSILAHPSPESVETIISNFKLYPNPANDKITIESSTDLSDAVIEIENASGQSVYYTLLSQNNKDYEIDISALADGFYILKITSDNQIKLMKFVKK